MGVRMTHPTLPGQDYDAQPQQVPHLRAAGWQVAPGQDDQGETWPADLERFEGQAEVRMRHPDLDTEIRVAESAVPQHRSTGWLLVEEEQAEPVGADEVKDLEDLTVAQLQDRARDAGLPVSGTKAELVTRLREAEEPAGVEPAPPQQEEA